MKYDQLLDKKRIIAIPSGFHPIELHPDLKPFQRALVTAACQGGKFALNAFTGGGKTLMGLSWSDNVIRHGNHGRVLGFMPLAVAAQTVEEGRKWGFDVNLCESQDDIKPGINVTNYEKRHKFHNTGLDGIWWDESSILKDASGKTFAAMMDFAQPIPYRLSCTATPSPNDFIEFATQSQILGIMPIPEVKATFFRHDGGDTSKWRLSGWGDEKFWEFLASWSILIRKPSDIGFEDEGYTLPPIDDQFFIVNGDFQKDGELVSTVQSMSDRRIARKNSIDERCQLLAGIINQSSDQHIVWCKLNDESDLLEKLIPDSVQVAGRHTDKQKCDRMMGFSHGDYRVLISKPAICGWGMNWQHCHNVDFVGVDDSWESRHQATNRCYRFGQKHIVTRRTVYSAPEQVVLDNLARKQRQAEQLGDEMFKVYQRLGVASGQTSRRLIDYNPQITMELPQWLTA